VQDERHAIIAMVNAYREAWRRECMGQQQKLARGMSSQSNIERHGVENIQDGMRILKRHVCLP
jgi:hypothetical protein